MNRYVCAGWLYELWVEGQLCGRPAFSRERLDLDEPFGKAGVQHGGKVKETQLFSRRNPK